MRRVATVGLLALAAGVGLFIAKASSAEEPAHDVVTRDGDFEIRDYPALTIAEVTVRADRYTAGNAGFRKLAGYIFGGNVGQEKFAMTAPVIEARAQSAPGEAWTIRFVMPPGARLATMPKPDDSAVRLCETPPARYAVVRYSGYADDHSTAARTEALEAWMQTRGLAAAGAPLIAQYNPPFIPGFMRRNEIMIPVR